MRELKRMAYQVFWCDLIYFIGHFPKYSQTISGRNFSSGVEIVGHVIFSRAHQFEKIAYSQKT